MNMQRFVAWCETATSRQRADGYAILARALSESSISPHERDASVAALHLALDDPSPKVRIAVADRLSTIQDAPRSLLKGLLFDIDEIAVRVAASPVLADDDLLEGLLVAREPVRAAIAARPKLSSTVSAAVARIGGFISCKALAANESAAIPAAAFRRMVERHGGSPTLRSLILERGDLPADVRQTLILEIGHALQNAPFVVGILGSARAGRIAFQSCARATAAMAEWIDARDMPPLVDHLRTSGQLTPAFLIRIACAGNIDLLAASLTALSGLAERRVRAIVVDARQGPFRTLTRGCGLDDAAAMLLHLAVREWKDAATGGVPSHVRDVPEFVMQRVAAAFHRTQGRRLDGTSSFLRQLEGEAMRDAAQARLELLLAA